MFVEGATEKVYRKRECIPLSEYISLSNYSNLSVASVLDDMVGNREAINKHVAAYLALVII